MAKLNLTEIDKLTTLADSMSDKLWELSKDETYIPSTEDLEAIFECAKRCQDFSNALTVIHQMNPTWYELIEAADIDVGYLQDMI